MGTGRTGNAPRKAASIRVALAVATVVAGVGALSGCAAGFSPQTTPSMQPPQGANYPILGYTSSIAVRNAFVLVPSDSGSAPAGGDAAVYLSLINQRRQNDRLTGVTSPSAGSVVVQGTRAGGKSGTSIVVPAGDSTTDTGDPVQVGRPPYGDDTVTLTGLTEELTGTSIVTLELTFQRAGTIEMQVPVSVQSDETSSLSPAPSIAPSPESADPSPSSS